MIDAKRYETSLRDGKSKSLGKGLENPFLNGFPMMPRRRPPLRGGRHRSSSVSDAVRRQQKKQRVHTRRSPGMTPNPFHGRSIVIVTRMIL